MNKFTFTFLLLLLSNCQGTNEAFSQKKATKTSTLDKQKGAHLFGFRDSMNFQLLSQNNIEWVTLVPWGFQFDYDSQVMNHHNGDSLRILRRDSSWIRRIKLVRSKGFKVFVKPHVWLDEPSAGKWRSDIAPVNDENWALWKASYRDFMLRYAKIAEQTQAEMFCIGTEFSKLSVNKPTFWKEIIQEVRTIYSGKITYAANWYDEYEKITFWDDLDFIGIQAYFPLVKNKNPTVQQISKGWNKYLSHMESITKKYNRPILFTEMGYKSTADSAIKPWEWIDYSNRETKKESPETQANCYAAFFNTVWKKEWFAGVHIWQLRNDYESDRSERRRNRVHLDFTPQGKIAEGVIAKGFE